MLLGCRFFGQVMKTIDFRYKLMMGARNALMDPSREERPWYELRSGAAGIEGKVTLAIYGRVIWPIIRSIEDER
jgi:hypothetical protein